MKKTNDYTYMITGKDLIVPGSELKTYQENVVGEEEDNRLCIQGSDHNDDLEETIRRWESCRYLN